MLHGRTPADLGRRGLLKSGAYALAAASAGWSVLAPRSAAAAARIVVKYDWLISNGQIGDVVALKKGYFEAEGLDVTLSPGGPNSATVPPVIAGQAKFGQFSDSAQLLLARAAGVPVKIMACGFRASPFAFYSLPRAPIRSVQDMVGKRIGVQPTARFVLDAILVKNKIDPSSLVVTNIGFDMTPLMTGQVDAVTGWITNTKALAVIGPDRIDLPMKDTGLPSYANVYFATDEALGRDAETLAKALRAIPKTPRTSRWTPTLSSTATSSSRRCRASWRSASTRPRKTRAGARSTRPPSRNRSRSMTGSVSSRVAPPGWRTASRTRS